jgi:putative SOS response-associated peptidase YedK
VPELPLRYNIAPTQPVAAVRQAAGPGPRELVQLRWGLIPSWAEDKKIGARLINARAETAAAKPSFRSAFRHRRCLVPADGFYEWQRRDGKKQPYHLRLRDDRPFAFAGLWETWTKRCRAGKR